MSWSINTYDEEGRRCQTTLTRGGRVCCVDRVRERVDTVLFIVDQ